MNEFTKIEKQLNKIDLHNGNKYDLLNLYESVMLGEEDEKTLSEMLESNAEAEKIHDFLCGTLNEDFDGILSESSNGYFAYHDQIVDALIARCQREGVLSTDSETLLNQLADALGVEQEDIEDESYIDINELIAFCQRQGVLPTTSDELIDDIESITDLEREDIEELLDESLSKNESLGEGLDEDAFKKLPHIMYGYKDEETPNTYILRTRAFTTPRQVYGAYSDIESALRKMFGGSIKSINHYGTDYDPHSNRRAFRVRVIFKEDPFSKNEGLVEDFYDDEYDDFELASIYGGDFTYCPVCGATMEYDEDGDHYCPKCKKSGHTLSLIRRGFIKDDNESLSESFDMNSIDFEDASNNKDAMGIINGYKGESRYFALAINNKTHEVILHRNSYDLGWSIRHLLKSIRANLHYNEGSIDDWSFYKYTNENVSPTVIDKSSFNYKGYTILPGNNEWEIVSPDGKKDYVPIDPADKDGGWEKAKEFVDGIVGESLSEDTVKQGTERTMAYLKGVCKMTKKEVSDETIYSLYDGDGKFIMSSPNYRKIYREYKERTIPYLPKGAHIEDDTCGGLYEDTIKQGSQWVNKGKEGVKESIEDVWDDASISGDSMNYKGHEIKLTPYGYQVTFDNGEEIEFADDREAMEYIDSLNEDVNEKPFVDRGRDSLKSNVKELSTSEGFKDISDDVVLIDENGVAKGSEDLYRKFMSKLVPDELSYKSVTVYPSVFGDDEKEIGWSYTPNPDDVKMYIEEFELDTISKNPKITVGDFRKINADRLYGALLDHFRDEAEDDANEHYFD